MKYLFWMVLVLSVFAGLTACDKEDGGGSVNLGGGPTPVPDPLSITTTTTLPVASEGMAYSTTLQATGGTSPYHWGLLASTLPPGISIGLNTGTLTGTPTANGVFSFTVRCQDSASPFAQAIRVFDLTVNAAPPGPTGTFGNLTAYPAHVWPYGLAAADFDGDTKPDLAVANFQVGTFNGAFSILTNTDSRTFSTPLVYPQPSSYEVREVITADLNGDAKADVVVASYGNNYVQVYLNDGFGGLTAQAAITVLGPSSLSAGDMTNDGVPDVVVGSDWSSGLSRVVVCVNNGAGVLTPATDVLLSGMTGQVFVKTCMFSVTAMPGVVVIGQSSSTLYAMLATTGNPTWLTTPVANALDAGGNPYDMALGDFDADGKIDVAVVNSLGVSTVTLMQGTGTANFTSAGSLTAGNSSAGIVAGDFDADGKPDIAVTNSGSVSVFLNDGAWVFQAGVDYAAGVRPWRILTADFDDDGFLDLAFTDNPEAVTGGTVVILYGE